MKITIDYYITKKTLRSSFSSASGTLASKEILILTFRRESNVEFAFELPLSPSMGEMPRDTLQMAEDGVLSKYSQIALSYYLELIVNRHALKIQENPLMRIKVSTYGIGDKVDISDVSNVIRIKGAPSNIEEIIKFSHTTNSRWIVDFNSSLTDEIFESFLNKAKLQNVLYIEQPLSDYASVSKFSATIWADESVKSQKSISKLKDLGFNGIVIKPINYKFNELLRLLNDAENASMPVIVGSVISDSLFGAFVEVFNSCVSVNVENLSTISGDFIQSPKIKNPYRIDEHGIMNFDNSFLSEILENYEYVESNVVVL